MKISIPSKNQFGFQAGRSTYMAIASVFHLDEITCALDQRYSSIGVFIDLSKAFDTVDHNILLEKLYLYGIRGAPHDLMRSYLSDRSQYVFLNGTPSSMLPISCGVPQGSILGPLLFFLYIDDLQYCSEVLKCVLFADDTNMFLTDKNSELVFHRLNVELVHVSDWFKVNKLSLNLTKTHYILFDNKRRSVNSLHSVSFDCVPIPRTTATKFLGVIIDEKLTWQSHINYVLNKISRNAAVLQRIRYKVNAAVMLQLYDTMILPYISYCAIIWASVSNNKLKKIHTVQKRVLRLVLHVDRMSRSRPIFFKLKRLAVQDIYKMQVLSFMYSCLHGEMSFLVANRFQYNFQIHPYSTRISKKLHQACARTCVRNTSLLVKGPLIWNELPCALTGLGSFYAFKKATKFFLLSSYAPV